MNPRIMPSFVIDQRNVRSYFEVLKSVLNMANMAVRQFAFRNIVETIKSRKVMKKLQKK